MESNFVSSVILNRNSMASMASTSVPKQWYMNTEGMY